MMVGVYVTSKRLTITMIRIDSHGCGGSGAPMYARRPRLTSANATPNEAVLGEKRMASTAYGIWKPRLFIRVYKVV